MTVRHLARYNINYIEYLLSKVKPLRKPFTPIEIRKGHYVIDIPVKETIIGHVNGKRNLLNYEFWTLVFYLISGNNICFPYNCNNACNNPCTGSGFLEYGFGTESSTFSMVSLQNLGGSIPEQITLGTLSDRSRITYFGGLPSNLSQSATEIGITVNFGYGGCTPLIGRLTGSFAPATTVSYYVDFLEPWTYNMASLIYSYIVCTYSTVITTSGSSESLVGWDQNGYNKIGMATLIGSENQYTWEPGIYSITQDVSFGTSHSVVIQNTYAYDYIIGTVTPSETITIETLGLVASNILLLVLPLSSPITLNAGQSNTVSLRLVAE